MAHIRSVSAGRSVPYALSLGAPLMDLLYDLYAATTQFVYRKKFEPIDGGGGGS